MDDGNLAAEPAHRLREFQADVAAADHNQMLGKLIQFKRLDMREWLRIGQAGHCIQCSPRTGADDYIGSAEAANLSVRESGFQSLRADEASRSENEFRARLLEVLQIHIVQARYHRAFSGAHSAMSTRKPSAAKPNSSPLRKYDAILAL